MTPAVVITIGFLSGHTMGRIIGSSLRQMQVSLISPGGGLLSLSRPMAPLNQQ